MHWRIVLIVTAELFGTSLWFSGNNAIRELASEWNLTGPAKAWLLMAVQLGFIVGTLGLSVSGLADRFRAHLLFAIAACVGAAANVAFLNCDGPAEAIACRFVTGLALAGIYPLGMKLVVSWAPDRAGMVLGWLVGAVAGGTATPFLARAIGGDRFWREAVLASSILAAISAAIILFVGQGPAVKGRRRFAWGDAWRMFRIRDFRASAFGYFGHMWELYAFWAMTPALVGLVLNDTASVPLGTFCIIGAGALGCVVGGRVSRSRGSLFVARTALAASGILCVLSPLLPNIPPMAAMAMLVAWGFFVVADSPQFSAMSAKACPPDAVGSALSIQNSIGFAITIASIQLTAVCWEFWHEWTPLILVPGPLLGLLAMRRANG